MAEFLVLRRYGQRGIGTQLAEKVWLHCPGRWQIRVMEKNVLARTFWESSICEVHRRTSPIHTLREGRSRMASVFTRLASIIRKRKTETATRARCTRDGSCRLDSSLDRACGTTRSAAGTCPIIRLNQRIWAELAGGSRLVEPGRRNVHRNAPGPRALPV
jgi:hypothetical protein